MADMLAVAGACGVQNTPPGAWETALFNRLQGCALQVLHTALYETRQLLQAWSFRGVPVVFPTEQSGVFLTPLVAMPGEQPWVYTLGVSGALEYLQMPFDDVLSHTMQAAKWLDGHTVKSKEALDKALADIVLEALPAEKQALWCAPSMYGRPDRQTVGGAAVSFMLRPCAFHSLVVFGKRQGVSPTFTSYKNWVGHAPTPVRNGHKQLVRKFLHCYGPATVEHFKSWLGCSGRQAKRLWGCIADEMQPVQVEGKTKYILAADSASLHTAECTQDELLLLGPHDPYLDIRDRNIILEDKALQKTVWQYVANPGVVLKGGRAIGIWKTKATGPKLEIALQLWESTTAAEQRCLRARAEEYAVFRTRQLKNVTIH